MTGAHAVGLPPREADSASASAVKALQAEGRLPEARERYAEIVARHQRRAARIAFHYMRDAAEADEAVQDAFVKAYSHLASFREELPFEVWFTRILINGCLDRIKARTRRERWLVPAPEPAPGQSGLHGPCGRGWPLARRSAACPRAPPEAGRRAARLPERQRSVFMLSHYEGCTSREVSALTGLNESTVRVHLFRAIRRLRTLLTDDRKQDRRGHRRTNSCPFLMHWAGGAIWTTTRSIVMWSDRAAATGTDGVPAADAHLAACSRARRATRRSTDWLADLRADTIGRSGRHVSARTAGGPAGQIARRLEALERPARVIVFPTPRGRPATVTSSGPQRWIAAAAAAGLIVGLGAGELLDLQRLDARRGTRASPAAGARCRRASGVQPIALSSDDSFLYDSEAAAPRVEALQALDALTPRVRDLDAAQVGSCHLRSR